jgi:hypothetical protein
MPDTNSQHAFAPALILDSACEIVRMITSFYLCFVTLPRSRLKAQQLIYGRVSAADVRLLHTTTQDNGDTHIRGMNGSDDAEHKETR